VSKILNHPLINARCFYPLLGEIDDPFWINCGDAQLACCYRQVEHAVGTLVHFHGNGEIVDDWQDFAWQMNYNGWNCLLVEYRGYGRSTGRAQMGAVLADVTPILEALKPFSRPIIVFGRSLGSLFAMEAVERFPQIKGVILESAIADVRTSLLAKVRAHDLGVTSAEFACTIDNALNQQRKMMSFMGAILVMHTENDELINVDHARTLYSCGQGKKKLVVFKRGNHNTIMTANSVDYYRVVGDFLRTLPH
jgi:alpha-beta hydrolase superfamily lysophospholipase